MSGHRGRASIGAWTLRTDWWWAYLAVTFAVLLGVKQGAEGGS